MGLLGGSPAMAQLVLPGAQNPSAPGTAAPPPATSAPAVPPRVAAPQAARPTGIDGIVGRTLLRNGMEGSSLRIEREGRSTYRARAVFEGRLISDPTQACAIDMGSQGALALEAKGEADGLPRFAFEAPACPLEFDLLEGAVLVTAPRPACEFTAADCRVEVTGLWGPAGATLAARAKEFETARARADTAVREGYRALAARSGPGQTRPIVAEQAGFSSERETVCRDYAGEGQHGFCHTRFTEGRAASLRVRAGNLPPVPDAEQPRGRPAAPPLAAPPTQIY